MGAELSAERIIKCEVADKFRMKIAVLSDIHGNWPALQAVTADIEQWRPDLVVVNGDTVNRGPSNLACLQFVLRQQREVGWVVLRGNHEDYVLVSTNPEAAQSGPQFELRSFSEWTYNQIGADHAHDLAAMPDRFGIRAADGTMLMVMHASVLGNRVGIYPLTTAEELRCRIAPGPAVFVTSHTHRVLTRHVDNTLVVNIGSAGLPFDEDVLVSYGRFTWTTAAGWQAEVRRLDYDRAQAEREMVTTGFLDEAGPFAPLILAELRIAQGLIGRWAHSYQEPFLQGEISLVESVNRFVEEGGYRPYLRRP